MTTANSPEPAATGAPGPVLRIVSGSPSVEELAAVTAVLSAAGASTGAANQPSAEVGGWSDLSLRLRRPLPIGPGSWRNSVWH